MWMWGADLLEIMESEADPRLPPFYYRLDEVGVGKGLGSCARACKRCEDHHERTTEGGGRLSRGWRQRFYLARTSQVARTGRLDGTPRKLPLMEALREAGHVVAPVHVDAKALRTDASMAQVVAVARRLAAVVSQRDAQ
jgi:hypothetical protein